MSPSPVDGHAIEHWPGRIPQLKRGQRLYICDGTPWREALDSYVHGTYEFRGWRIQRTYRVGDLILTYITTSPRMVLCLETALTDSSSATENIDVEDEKVTFGNGILLDRVRDLSGVEVREDRFYTGHEAKSILNALAAEEARGVPWLTPQTWANQNLDSCGD